MLDIPANPDPAQTNVWHHWIPSVLLAVSLWIVILHCLGFDSEVILPGSLGVVLTIAWASYGLEDLFAWLRGWEGKRHGLPRFTLRRLFGWTLLAALVWKTFAVLIPVHSKVLAGAVLIVFLGMIAFVLITVALLGANCLMWVANRILACYLRYLRRKHRS